MPQLLIVLFVCFIRLSASVESFLFAPLPVVFFASKEPLILLATTWNCFLRFVNFPCTDGSWKDAHQSLFRLSVPSGSFREFYRSCSQKEDKNGKEDAENLRRGKARFIYHEAEECDAERSKEVS